MQWGAGKQTFPSCKDIAMGSRKLGYVGGCDTDNSDAAARRSLMESKHAQPQVKTTELL